MLTVIRRSPGGWPGAAAARVSRTEHAVKDVLETAAEAAGARTRTSTAAAEGVGLETARPRARAWTAARKTLETRLAVGIDLAAIELLPLVRVPNDLVRGI